MLRLVEFILLCYKRSLSYAINSTVLQNLKPFETAVFVMHTDVLYVGLIHHGRVIILLISELFCRQTTSLTASLHQGTCVLLSTCDSDKFGQSLESQSQIIMLCQLKQNLLQKSCYLSSTSQALFLSYFIEFHWL